MTEPESNNIWINQTRISNGQGTSNYEVGEDENHQYENPVHSPVEAIVNISKRQLTTPEKSVLNKGLNFASTIKPIPYLDLTAPIEDAALKILKAIPKA